MSAPASHGIRESRLPTAEAYKQAPVLILLILLSDLQLQFCLLSTCAAPAVVAILKLQIQHPSCCQTSESCSSVSAKVPKRASSGDVVDVPAPALSLRSVPQSSHRYVLVTFQFYYFSNLLVLLFSVAGVVAVLLLQLRQHPVVVGRPMRVPPVRANQR